MQLLYFKVEQLTQSLVLSNKTLTEICNTFQSQLVAGLSSTSARPSDDALRLFPTFITHLPTGQECGDYLALDLGGTNFRVLLIKLTGNSRSLVSNRTFSVSQKLMTGSGEALFDYIGQCVYDFVAEHSLLGRHLPLGFTFSFPCQQTSTKRAILSQWTKGFSASGVVGNDVGELLARSLERFGDSLNIEIVAIVNDTAGTLVSCAYQDPDCRIGFIVGTGVNACYMETAHLRRPMIINTELGNFGSHGGALDCVTTEWDRTADQCSINPGAQIFEKMVSGMYLGELVRRVLLSVTTSHSHCFSPEFCERISQRNSFPTSFLSEIELDSVNGPYTNTEKVLHQLGLEEVNHEQCFALHLICTRVSSRSAHLVAAVATALLRHIHHRPSTTIGFDGTVYRCHPHFRSRVDAKTGELLREMNCQSLDFRLMLSEDGSGRGAALTAALPLQNSSSPTKTLFTSTAAAAAAAVAAVAMICANCRQETQVRRNCPQCLDVAISV